MRGGTKHALLEGVGARTHRDLEAWQYADRVRRRVLELTAHPSVRNDRDFVWQAQRAAASSCRNLAEGFYRYRHREFAHFVNIARSSLGELLDSNDEARLKGYVSAEEQQDFEALIQEAMRVANGLYRYLNGSDG